MAEDEKADIMVVDDTAANLQVLNAMLRRRGFKVRPVPNGRLALKAAEAQPPDLILLDINMPEMDGYEVCTRLKEHPALRNIPVIFLSALHEPLDKVEAFARGGVDYITKPFQIEELEARIATHLEIHRLRLALEDKNRTLDASNVRLRELESLRDSLTSMLVHDMRAPLSGIYSYLQLLELDLADKLEEQQRRDFAQAMQSSQTLIRMISDILDVSRMEEARMPLCMQVCEIQPLAEKGVADLGGLSRGRALRWDSPAEPLRASCDAELVRRIVANLVGNALKFSPPDKEIVLSFSRAEGMARIAVTDAGGGIPVEAQSTIFEKFLQVEKGARRPRGATGLGLAFCKLAVNAQGGDIGVESEPGEGGSTFWFTLRAE